MRQLCTILGKFQELNFIILRLRINLSHNDTNTQSFAFLGGNMHNTPRYRDYLMCTNF